VEETKRRSRLTRRQPSATPRTCQVDAIPRLFFLYLVAEANSTSLNVHSQPWALLSDPQTSQSPQAVHSTIDSLLDIHSSSPPVQFSLSDILELILNAGTSGRVDTSLRLYLRRLQGIAIGGSFPSDLDTFIVRGRQIEARDSDLA
jgi:hypothetical protein